MECDMSRTLHHGNKAKQRIFSEDWRWLRSTPSWWTKLTMNRPQKRKFQRYEQTVLKSKIEDLLGLLEPEAGKKPHVYYW